MTGTPRRLPIYLSAALAVVVAATLGPGRPRDAVAAFTQDSALLVTDRDRLRLCIELAPAAARTAPQVSDALLQALRRLRQHPDWERAGLGSETPAPELGCPGARLPAATLKVDQIVGPGRTTVPGPHRTAVFVLDDATARAVLGPRRAAFATFEFMCLPGPNAHQCMEVTRALLARQDFVTTPEFVDTYLTLAIGLRPLTPNGSRFPLPPGVKGSK